jgi:hypothetical protein
MSMLRERTMLDLAQLSLRIFGTNSAFFWRYMKDCIVYPSEIPCVFIQKLGASVGD